MGKRYFYVLAALYVMALLPVMPENNLKVVAAEVTTSATLTKDGDSYTFADMDQSVESKKVGYLKIVPEAAGTYRVYTPSQNSEIIFYSESVADSNKIISSRNTGEGCKVLLQAGASYYVAAGFTSQGAKGNITVCMDKISKADVLVYDTVDGSVVEKNIAEGETVAGLTWDEDSNTLTMSGYNGGAIDVKKNAVNASIEINVVITGNNTIDMSKAVSGNTSSGLEVDVECFISGSGQLSIIGAVGESYAGIAAQRLVIDGPTIRCENVVGGIGTSGWSDEWCDEFGDPHQPNGLVVKSGTFIINLIPQIYTPKNSGYDVRFQYEEALYSESSIDVEGGNFIVSYAYDDIEYTNVEVDSICVIFANWGDLNVSGDVNVVVAANEALGEINIFDADIEKYSKNVDEQTVKIDKQVVTGKGTSAAIDISKLSAKLSQDSYVYDGKEKKPSVVISGLVAGTDYSVAYDKNVNAGKAAVVLKGQGLFTGSKTLEFAITQADLSGLSAKLTQSTYEYDGTEKMPDVIISGLKAGTDYTVAYSNNKNAGTASAVISGINNYKGTQTLKFMITKKGDVVDGASEIVYGPKAGSAFKVGSYKYKVIKSADRSGGVGEVSITGAKSKTIKSVKVGSSVVNDGLTYNITAVSGKAFKGYSKLKTVTIGSNVTSIGDNAFAGCKKLTTVNINSKGLKTIGKNAFKSDKKLKTVKIKSTALTKIGGKAFKGINGKAVIKMPKSKLSKYKKLIKKAGAGKQVKYKKL